MRKSFQLHYEWDIVQIRSEVREMARTLGFDELDQTRIAQSLSELARNVIQHADSGLITISAVEENGKKGLMIRVEDMGPGIQNFEKKARGNASPGETTGLQHVDVLMDELRQIPIESGTCVEAVKWLKTSRMLSEKE